MADVEFRPDAGRYWLNHLAMAVVLGAAAGIALVVMGNPYPWTGPVAAALALGLRGLYLRSEAMADVWRLTDNALVGPGARRVALVDITLVRKLMGHVQVVTKQGDKILIRYLADAPSAVAAIEAARKRA
ncbi:hypothetical protein [Neotabrizicola shimadae]|uniref:Uncharacterized protein n=1 Tax=Neotabrizicola shimadae TaxID=2807096 RepID=A0A8G0ZSN9_9RHOB|nr:hypothetical protein [Neotabrizicola shimadae]QYZ68211.1 hypothetical protein JO391_10425 [Neotabrizicola shimadae]